MSKQRPSGRPKPTSSGSSPAVDPDTAPPDNTEAFEPAEAAVEPTEAAENPGEIPEMPPKHPVKLQAFYQYPSGNGPDIIEMSIEGSVAKFEKTGEVTREGHILYTGSLSAAQLDAVKGATGWVVKES